ncbi:hypothetical protein [Bordetella sp. 2513F-2]
MGNKDGTDGEMTTDMAKAGEKERKFGKQPVTSGKEARSGALL